MSKIIPISMRFDSKDFEFGPKDLGLEENDIFTGVLSIACRVGILSNPTIPPIDVDVDVDSQDDHGLTTETTFEDGDGNKHTLAVVMSPNALGVIVTDEQGEVEDHVDVEVKVRVEVDSAVPPKLKKEEEVKTPSSSDQVIKPELQKQDEQKDLRDYAVKETDSVAKMMDHSRTIYVLGQDDLIYIVGLDEELDYEKCASELMDQWRKESLDNLDAEDKKLIKDDMVTLLPFEVAIKIQDRLIDILERTYGIPVLTAQSGTKFYYLPLVDREGTPYDPSLIACLDWDLWKTSKNILASQLTQLTYDKGISVLTMKQALIKQQYIKSK
jgi:hypothetical protein